MSGIDPKLIARINELAKKKKEGTITDIYRNLFKFRHFCV